MIRCRLYRVMADRDIRTVKELVQLSGVNRKTLSDMMGDAGGRLTRYEVSVLDRLCRALNCTPGDLIEYAPDEVALTQKKTQEKTPAITLAEQRRQAVDMLAKG